MELSPVGRQLAVHGPDWSRRAEGQGPRGRAFLISLNDCWSFFHLTFFSLVISFCPSDIFFFDSFVPMIPFALEFFFLLPHFYLFFFPSVPPQFFLSCPVFLYRGILSVYLTVSLSFSSPPPTSLTLTGSCPLSFTAWLTPHSPPPFLAQAYLTLDL